jgi:Cof subfamily protein (haloacid dehalogenase superfamily)
VDPLYICDLDGTLLRNDASLSEYSREGLVSLIQEGVAITVASARSVSSMKALLGDIPFRLPVIEANGAFVSDYATGRHEHVSAIPPRPARRAFELILSAGCVPFLPVYDGERDLVYYDTAENDGMRAYLEERRVYRDERLRRTDDLKGVVTDPGSRLVGFTVIDLPDRVFPLAEQIGRRFHERLTPTIYEYRYFPGWYFLTIHDRRASKDQAIAVLKRRAGLGRAPLVVFGDESNDEGMFRIASRAVAPSNARDAIKALAHEVIGSNEEDSVIRYIRAHSRQRSTA